MAKEKILIIDDDTDINELISLYLKRENYTILNAFDGKDALKMVSRHNPNLIILDVLLPDILGTELCIEIRKLTLAPIIFLSCKGEEVDKIKGFEVGGDDYICKPFSPRELVARIKSNLRRATYSTLNTSKILNDNKTINLPNITIDLNNYLVISNNKITHLSVKELELLTFLVNNPNQIFSMEQLYDEIWGSKSFGDTRTVMVHISNLRKKIEEDPSNPRYILNIRGAGYKFALH